MNTENTPPSPLDDLPAIEGGTDAVVEYLNRLEEEMIEEISGSAQEQAERYARCEKVAEAVATHLYAKEHAATLPTDWLVIESPAVSGKLYDIIFAAGERQPEGELPRSGVSMHGVDSSGVRPDKQPRWVAWHEHVGDIGHFDTFAAAFDFAKTGRK